MEHAASRSTSASSHRSDSKAGDVLRMSKATEWTPLAPGAVKPGEAEEAAAPKVSRMRLVVNLITAGLGTGIFTLPWSVAGASLIPGLVIIALVLAVNAWTISILIHAAERHQAFDLGTLLGRVSGRLGPFLQVVCNITVFLTMFASLVSYIIVIADSFEAISGWARVHRNFVAVLSSATVLPLCFLDQEHLSLSSIVAVAGDALILMVILGFLVQKEHLGEQPEACVFGIAQGSFAMISAMMATVLIQMCTPPMYAQLEDKTPARFNSAVFIAFSVLFVLFAGFAIVGYLSFGPEVKSNVILSLPPNGMANLARIVAAAGVVTVYPLILGPMVAPIRDTQARILSARNLRAMAATVAIVCLVLVTSFFVRDLGYINVLNGAITSGVFVGIVPSIVGLQLLGPEDQTWAWRLAMYALLICGLTFSVFGIIYSDNYYADLHKACLLGVGHV